MPVMIARTATPRGKTFPASGTWSRQPRTPGPSTPNTRTGKHAGRRVDRDRGDPARELQGSGPDEDVIDDYLPFSGWTGSSAVVCPTHVLVSGPIDAATREWHVRALGSAK
jgi:hypothetical protein